METSSKVITVGSYEELLNHLYSLGKQYEYCNNGMEDDWDEGQYIWVEASRSKTQAKDDDYRFVVDGRIQFSALRKRLEDDGYYGSDGIDFGRVVADMDKRRRLLQAKSKHLKLDILKWAVGLLTPAAVAIGIAVYSSNKSSQRVDKMEVELRQLSERVSTLSKAMPTTTHATQP